MRPNASVIQMDGVLMERSFQKRITDKTTRRHPFLSTKYMNATQQLKREMGFEKRPPACKSCINYKRPFVMPMNCKLNTKIHGVCGKGGFAVDPWSICDEWTNTKGHVIHNKFNTVTK